MLSGSKLVIDQIRTCLRPASNQLAFEPASVMEFGFNTTSCCSTAILNALDMFLGRFAVLHMWPRRPSVTTLRIYARYVHRCGLSLQKGS